MIQYIIAKKDDIELLMKSRIEMLQAVNCLPATHEFDQELMNQTRAYFESENHATVLALESIESKESEVIGCATLCYTQVMPTFSHPTGKRAHLINVYTHSDYRNQGIASHMIEMLISIAKTNGVTEITLDATELGRVIYQKCDFVDSKNHMVLDLR